MKPKYYWIKERYNPQFEKPYYVLYGNIKMKDALKMTNPLYGDNTMLRYNNLNAYNAKIKMLKDEGFLVQEIKAEQEKQRVVSNGGDARTDNKPTLSIEPDDGYEMDKSHDKERI